MLLVWMAAAGAQAESRVVASSVITYEERLRVEGCAPYRGQGMLGLALYSDSRFALTMDAGTFTGRFEQRGRDPGAFRLLFDEASLFFYSVYLKAGATVLCGTDVAIADGEIRTAVLRFRRNGTVSLDLRTTAHAASALGAGRGSHRLGGQGALVSPPAPPPLPSPELNL
jgi:hypothetical protein